ncbi:undecaprenyl-phosphate glucose phosphotransferase [Photobacterium sp. BZF1]|uniref:undecaprenyl-phosphate glucose phosphotransferase n=1 Tax=Photobacterium sp. BZF1 TaxID=1904457 RepID=UPI002107AAC9|nr:undecaprenyl-phosphate glucose phosphotransferase [Photobacterium sp. BZF1]
MKKMLDVFVIVATLLGASHLYLGSIEKNYYILAAIASVLFLFIAEAGDLYRNQDFTTTLYKVKRLSICWALTVLIMLMLAFFAKQSEVHSRVVVGVWCISVPYFMSMTRVIIRFLKTYVLAREKYKHRAIVIGATLPGYDIAKAICQNEALLTFEGIYDDIEKSDFIEESRKKEANANLAFTLQGNIEQALVLAKSREVRHVFIALKPLGTERVKQLIQRFSDTTAQVYVVPDLQTYELVQSRWRNINGIPAISVHDTPFSGVTSLVKRIEDVLMASMIITLISPVLLFVAAGVKMSSPGPIIFKQYRYGIDGKKIKVWKFRSMSAQDNGNVVKQATKNDPRVTKFGAFIRRTSLDELPQFFNVLQGRMSIVGPRPHAVAHNEEYRSIVDRYMLRHKVKPGITGLAQVNGYRGETDTLDKMEKRVEYDLKYIRTWSLWLDLKIIFMTVFKGFVGKTAY